MKHELSHSHFCKNDPSGGHSCKHKGRGACVCKDDHPRPRACQVVVLANASSPALALCFISHRCDKREVTPSPLCFSSQRGRPSAHSTTKCVNVNVSINHPRGIPFTLNNMPSSHIVFDVMDNDVNDLSHILTTRRGCPFLSHQKLPINVMHQEKYLEPRAF